MTNTYQTHIDFIDNGYCLKRRVLFISKIDGDAMEEALRIIMMMEEISSQPITLHINSYGGSVYEGLALYDHIRDSNCFITTIASGKIMSMGVILFLSGDCREIYNSAKFMMHSVGSATAGRLEEQMNDVEETKSLNNRLIEIISERSNMTIKETKKIAGAIDYFFDKEEAIERGFSHDGVHR